MRCVPRLGVLLCLVAALLVGCSDDTAGGSDPCDPSPCDPRAVCETLDGKVSCRCPPGLVGDGFVCADPDPCASGPCFPGVACTTAPEVASGYTCGACPDGYRGDGEVCTDVDECAERVDDCVLHADCVNTTGSFDCVCWPRYVDSGSGCDCPILPDLEVGELDVLQAAINPYGITRCDLFYDSEVSAVLPPALAGARFALQVADDAHDDLLGNASRVADLLARLGQDPHNAFPYNVGDTLRLAADELGQGSNASTIDVAGVSLCDAVASLWAGSGQAAPDCSTLTGLVAADAVLPGLAELIAAVAWAAAEREALLPTGADELEQLSAELHRLYFAGEGALPPLDGVLVSFDYARMYAVAAALATFIEAHPIVPDRSGGPIVADVRLVTPRGLIVVRGDADDTYAEPDPGCDGVQDCTVLDAPVVLLADSGGSDSHLAHAGGTAGVTEHVSILLDLGGNDLYSYSPTDTGTGYLLPADAGGRGVDPPLSLSMASRQGAGRGGIGMLFDQGQSDDRYESLRMSQGFGLLGVGVLRDDGGSDTFAAESLSQGAGLFGIGLLLVGPGASSFNGLHLVQGVGAPGGAGLLIDEGGDDAYVASPGDPSAVMVAPPMLAGRANWSAGQGCGVGLSRGDAMDDVHLAGGIGVLVDGAGIDSYGAGVMAQGCGYLRGLGVVIDRAGDDLYEAYGVAQGAGWSLGVGLFSEQGGNEVYNTGIGGGQWILGAGNDFGVGVAIESSGQDTYAANTFSLGAGAAEGAGFFVDQGGNDTIEVTEAESLGFALATGDTGGRGTVFTFGLFVDASGADTYGGRDLSDPPIGDGLAWTQQAGNGPFERGAGIDDDGGTGLTTFP